MMKNIDKLDLKLRKLYLEEHLDEMKFHKILHEQWYTPENDNHYKPKDYIVARFLYSQYLKNDIFKPKTVDDWKQDQYGNQHNIHYKNDKR